jgi:hypothetical protein
MFSVPVLVLTAPHELFAEPAVQFPVMFSVPVLVLFAPRLDVADPPVQLPTILPTDGLNEENCKQTGFEPTDLFVTFAVSVTPALSVKMPVPELLTSSQVTSAVMVIVCPVAACASSPTPGTTPPTHVAPALKLPLAADTMSAMA